MLTSRSSAPVVPRATKVRLGCPAYDVSRGRTSRRPRGAVGGGRPRRGTTPRARPRRPAQRRAFIGVEEPDPRGDVGRATEPCRGSGAGGTAVRRRGLPRGTSRRGTTRRNPSRPAPSSTSRPDHRTRAASGCGKAPPPVMRIPNDARRSAAWAEPARRARRAPAPAPTRRRPA